MEEKNQKTTQEAPNKSNEPQKKSAGKTVLIVLGILLALGLLCGGVGYFVLGGLVNKAQDELEEIGKTVSEIDYQEIIDETDKENAVEISEYPAVDEDTVDDDLISTQFADDIPVSGGKINKSSYTENHSVEVVIYTSSNAEEAFQWYVEQLEGAGWTISSKSRDEGSASIDFNNGVGSREDDYRRGTVIINDYLEQYGDWWNYTEIKIRELFY